jgi:putative phosphoesterase
MRLAAITDIHGNLPALEAVLADIARSGVDFTVNLGDIVSGPLWPVETAERLMALALPTIRGNHERQVLRPLEGMGAADRHAALRLTAPQRQWLAALPATLRLASDVFCCHGTPDNDLRYFLETVTPDCGINGSRGVRAATHDEAQERAGQVVASLILCGHTHQPRIRQLDDGRLIVNPGSVGLPAFDDNHPHFHLMEADSPHARYALLERHDGRWNVQLRSVAYDWEAAAVQADRNGRPDWADALRTGRVGTLEKDAPAVAAST